MGRRRGALADRRGGGGRQAAAAAGVLWIVRDEGCGWLLRKRGTRGASSRAVSGYFWTEDGRCRRNRGAAWGWLEAGTALHACSGRFWTEDAGRRRIIRVMGACSAGAVWRALFVCFGTDDAGRRCALFGYFWTEDFACRRGIWGGGRGWGVALRRAVVGPVVSCGVAESGGFAAAEAGVILFRRGVMRGVFAVENGGCCGADDGGVAWCNLLVMLGENRFLPGRPAVAD